MSTLSVHRLENVQDFDFANTPFVTAFNAANGAYDASNASYLATNTAYNFANSVNTFAYGVAVNAAAAFAAANNVAPQVTPAFLTGNLAYALANNAYASINSNWTVTNALYSVANSAYGAANNVGPQIAPTYNTANAAYGTANAAYAAANTKFSSSGGTISGAVEITADLTVHGNTRFVDQQTLSVGDPLIYLAANNYSSDVVDIGFVANYVNTGGANVHTGLYRSSGTKEYYLFQGYDKEPYNNYIDPAGNNITRAVLNADIRTSNLILGGANTINWITSNYNTTNASFGVSNAAFGKANNALANTTGSLAGNLTVAGGSITGASQSTYALSLGNVGGSSGDIAFGSDASYGYVQSWNGKPLCINNQGNNVGIGGAPSYKLHVAGTGYASSDFRAPIFYDSDNTAYYSDPHATSNFNALNILNGYFNNTGLTLQLGAGISTTSALGIGFNATDTNYAIYKPAGAWTKPLYIYFYTGIRNYSHSSYDYGQSFWNISTGNLMASFGQGDNHTRINYNLYAPIMYDLDNTGYYVDPASTTTSLQIAGAVEQGNNLARPLARWDASSASTGMVIFKLPGTAGGGGGGTSFGMVHMVFDIYEYSGNHAATVIVGGHNWSTTQWYNYGANVIGYTDKQVRVGIKDGQYCVVFGTSASSWSYGQIVLRKIQNGQYYDGTMDLGGTYTVSQTTTESFTWVSSDLRELRTPGTFSTGSRGITKASMPAGSVLQVVQTVLSSTASYAPNGTEQQVTGLAASITPSSSTSKILILLNINYSSGGTTYGGYFKRSGTVIGIGDAGGSQQRVGLGMALVTDGNQVNSFYYQYLDSPATTSSVAYTFWLNNDNTGTCFINRSQNDGSNNTGKRCISTVTLLEIAQ